jgi:hypothetical protein
MKRTYSHNILVNSIKGIKYQSYPTAPVKAEEIGDVYFDL